MAALEEQAIALDLIGEFPTGSGSYTLFQTLLRLVIPFSEAGSLRTVFETIFSTLSELAQDFEADLSATFPTARDLKTPLRLSKERLKTSPTALTLNNVSA